MIGIEQFGDVCKIVENLEVGSLSISIPMSVAA